MCGETEQSRMSCSECFSFGAAHPKLQKLNRGGTWPNLGRLVVYPESERWADLARNKNKWQKGFILLSWSYCSYQQTVPLLPPRSPFSTFLISAYQFSESLDILPLNSFSLSQSDGICCLQQVPDIIKETGRNGKIDKHGKSLLRSVLLLEVYLIFSKNLLLLLVFYGLHVGAPWIPPNSLVETKTQQDGIRRWDLWEVIR